MNANSISFGDNQTEIKEFVAHPDCTYPVMFSGFDLAVAPFRRCDINDRVYTLSDSSLKEGNRISICGHVESKFTMMSGHVKEIYTRKGGGKIITYDDFDAKIFPHGSLIALNNDSRDIVGVHVGFYDFKQVGVASLISPIREWIVATTAIFDRW